MVNSVQVSGIEKKVKLSFITSKVDNMDMTKSNIRVVDAMGKLGIKGRLEVHLKG